MPSFATKLKTYLPAILKETPSMGLFAEYYVYDPLKDEMVRKRTRLLSVVKKYRTARQRRLAAQELVDDINRKLSGGWTPLQSLASSFIMVFYFFLGYVLFFVSLQRR